MRNQPCVHTMIRTAGAGVALAAAALLVPQGVAAQACIGSPAMGGQFALGVGLSTSENTTGYGVEAHTNPAGPLAIGANIGVIDVDGQDDNNFTAGANVAWQLGTDLRICPVAGIQYMQTSSFSFGGVEGDGSVIGVPLGLAAGTWLGTGTVQFIPSAEGGLFWQRQSFDVTTAGVTASETNTETDLYLRGGLTGVFGQFYARGGLERIFVDDPENRFLFSVGVVF